MQCVLYENIIKKIIDYTEYIYNNLWVSCLKYKKAITDASIIEKTQEIQSKENCIKYDDISEKKLIHTTIAIGIKGFTDIMELI